MRKKIFLSVICILGLGLLAYAPIKTTLANVINNYYNCEEKQTVGSEGEILGAGYDVNSYKISEHIATTSPVYLSTTGSSQELVMSVENARHIDLNLAVTASTTSSILQWTYYFTNDESSATRNWYAEDGYTGTSLTAVTHGASGVTHSWTPASVLTIYKNIGIEPVAAKFMKIIFSAGTANLGLYAEGITQEEQN